MCSQIFLRHCHTPNHLCLKSRFNRKPCSNNYQMELILPLNLSRLSYFSFSTTLWKVSFALLFTHSPVSIFDHILETVFLEHNSNHVTPMLENLQKTLISHSNLTSIFKSHTSFSMQLCLSFPLKRGHCFFQWISQHLTSYHNYPYLSSSPYWRTRSTVTGSMSDSSECPTDSGENAVPIINTQIFDKWMKNSIPAFWI